MWPFCGIFGWNLFFRVESAAAFGDFLPEFFFFFFSSFSFSAIPDGWMSLPQRRIKNYENSKRNTTKGNLQRQGEDTIHMYSLAKLLGEIKDSRTSETGAVCSTFHYTAYMGRHWDFDLFFFHRGQYSVATIRNR